MHEHSDTVKTLQGWQNVTGADTVNTPGVTNPAGTVLQPLFPFEALSYATGQEAAQAAALRSQFFGQLVSEILQRHRAMDPFFKPPQMPMKTQEIEPFPQTTQFGDLP